MHFPDGGSGDLGLSETDGWFETDWLNADKAGPNLTQPVAEASVPSRLRAQATE